MVKKITQRARRKKKYRQKKKFNLRQNFLKRGGRHFRPKVGAQCSKEMKKKSAIL